MMLLATTKKPSKMNVCNCRNVNPQEFSETPGAGVRWVIGWKEGVLNSATCVRELHGGATPPHQIF
jgi:hypothetical protein